MALELHAYMIQWLLFSTVTFFSYHFFSTYTFGVRVAVVFFLGGIRIDYSTQPVFCDVVMGMYLWIYCTCNTIFGNGPII